MNIAELSDDAMIDLCRQFNLPIKYVDDFSRVLDRVYVSNQIATYFRKSTAPVPVLAKFTTVAAQNIYTVDDAPELENIVNKTPYTVTVDGSSATSKFYSWDNVSFELKGLDVTGDMEVVISAQ